MVCQVLWRVRKMLKGIRCTCLCSFRSDSFNIIGSISQLPHQGCWPEKKSYMVTKNTLVLLLCRQQIFDFTRCLLCFMLLLIFLVWAQCPQWCTLRNTFLKFTNSPTPLILTLMARLCHEKNQWGQKHYRIVSKMSVSLRAAISTKVYKLNA